MMKMKRTRSSSSLLLLEEEEEEEEYNKKMKMKMKMMMAKCVIEAKPIRVYRPPPPPPPSSTFECKTCNRRFSSFQALGGHRASHKKPRQPVGVNGADMETIKARPPAKKHECSICGVVFSMGQALGGHMRRHKALLMEMEGSSAETRASPALLLLRRSNSIVKAFAAANSSWWLDLNLTPLENDLKLLFAETPIPTTLDPFIS